MKKIVLILLASICIIPVFAHVGRHGTPTKTWTFTNGMTSMRADFMKTEGETVYLSSENHEILHVNLADLTNEDQRYILEKTAWISNVNSNEASNSTTSLTNYATLLLFIGIALLLGALFRIKKQSKQHLATYGFLGIAFVTLGCKNSKTLDSVKMARNQIPFLESVFGVFDKVQTRHDERYFYIESDGIPNHEMMTGITNWQQQVPINHDYSGSNAWAIPLQPELAENPLSTKDNFMKGAIAIAANGIPIFNPLNNRGEDANAIGELDKWGGHCGRADDYHYHLPPAHLQATVGRDKPIAFALDGFPLYGETKEQLDENLGRFTSDSTYQYHAIKEYPYLIAAMKGKVEINPRTEAPENEIIPQAKTRGVRPDLRPLRGAAINDFKKISETQYSLTYTIDALASKVNYRWDAHGEYTYEFIHLDGTKTVSTYTRK